MPALPPHGRSGTMDRMRLTLLAAAWLLWLPVAARALGPHELLIVANAASPASVALAREYMALRHIPDCNLVEVRLPAAAWAPPYELSTNEFTTLIWEPAQQAVKDRGIDDHILAWAYSIDVPVRITTDPPVSITGLTFVRNRLPPRDAIAQGLYASPFFAGSDNPSTSGFPPQSLDNHRSWQGAGMPVPAMLLGFAGPQGNTREEVQACLRRGAASDSTAPTGLVYLVANADIRTRCRQWEFPGAVRELRAADIGVATMEALPPEGPPVLGLMHGVSDVDLRRTPPFAPGCIVDNLTSCGAMFDGSSQTKLTAFIRAGATASAGTVTEPFSIWAKFSHARCFVHATAGCTVLESFYQAIKCPLQILPVGEPLAAPWKPAARVTLLGVPDGPLRDPATFTAVVRCDAGTTFSRTMFLLDGRTLQPAGRSNQATVSPAGLKPGSHTLRAVAYTAGPLRHQAFAEATLQVAP